ncbi:MAG TPA: DUF6786 family protein [Puia sp.]|nr:DUF6786 family protein [Puia sp.]
MFEACKHPSGSGSGYAPGSFGYDLHFLSARDSVIVLSSGSSSVIVSPKYQGKVFTSTALGDSGRSFGWVHYKAFDGPPDPHMNAYGGENRFWLGPEGGSFSLFFPPGAKMEFANWKTPAPFDTEAWDVLTRSGSAVELRKDMQLVNYAGTRLSLSVDRKISILDRVAIDSALGVRVDSAVAVVGYSTVNTLTNTGGQPWTATTGMPCMWLLDMFPPSPSTTIIIPYNVGDGSKPATTDYFGEIGPDRIHFADGVLRFKADGKSRGKLGIHPSRVRPFAGSYDSLNRVLTIIQFDVDTAGSGSTAHSGSSDAPARYLNQEWRTDRAPFSGDAMNAYNDGPLATGGQMGPFYELESVAPAAFLVPGGKQVHRHAVYHFTGDPAALDAICRKVLGSGVR